MLIGKMLPIVRVAIIIIKVETKRTFLSSVDIHSCVHSFNSDEILSAGFVFVLVSERNLGKRGTSAGVVHNVFHNTPQVTMEREG